MGCTADEAALAVHQAALLHGSSWRSPRWDRQPWLATGTASLRTTLGGLRQFHQRLETTFADIMAPADVDFMRRLLPLTDAWDRFATRPDCLWHRDFRIDNLLFDAADGTVPVAVLDWQTVTVGQGICDLAQLIGGSLTPDVRQRHESDLVREYHDVMTSLGVDRSLAQTWREYRIASLSAVITAVHAPTRVKRTDRGDAMWAVWSARHVQHAVEHEAVTLLRAIEQ